MFLNILIMFIHRYTMNKLKQRIKQSTVVVNMDFLKAFGTVNHDILMSKLQHNGVRGAMQSWFKFNLSNMKQYVSIKNCSSSMSNITLGVPHGSVLGKIHFLLFITDMLLKSD